MLDGHQLMTCFLLYLSVIPYSEQHVSMDTSIARGKYILKHNNSIESCKMTALSIEHTIDMLFPSSVHIHYCFFLQLEC